MIVEIVGIGFPNKGAELMLVAVQQQLIKKYGKIDFVVLPSTNYQGRSLHALFQKSWLKFKGVQIGHLFKIIPKKLKLRFGIIDDSDIDIIVDASGFAYGDQWGVTNAVHYMCDNIEKWKKEGKQVILLPQAFGPFSSKELQQKIAYIIENSDITFARDAISYSHLTKLLPDSNDIFQAPDFTNLVKGRLPEDLSDKELDVCIIPNSKMIIMSDHSIGLNYIPHMVSIITKFQDSGRKPFLLLHEGQLDLDLAHEINKSLDIPLEILIYDSPVDIKGVIGKSNILVSSRFHGLVSALSQGVPCVATGWSHKYKMLMNDYGVEEYLVADIKESDNCINTLLDKNKYNSIVQTIIKNGKEQKVKSELMWNKVFEKIVA